MMMKNLVLFAILMLANTVFAYPGKDLRTEERNLHPDCPKIDKGPATLLPHESDCTGYYMCQSGKAILKHCPHDLHFNPKKKVCDFPERAGCTSVDEQDEVFWSVGFPHSDCPSKDPNEPVILQHESDCTKFYICRNGLAHEKTCQFNLHFNPRLRVCDYPQNAKCALRFSDGQGDKPKCPKINKSIATLLPHETDCTQYYICESGEPIVRFCPDELHFNPKKLVCDFPERAGCETDDKKEVFWSVGFPHSDCPSKDPNEPVILPHESDCTKFYICRSGLAHEKTCQFNLHFNPRLRVCDYPQNAKCALRSSAREDDKQPKCPRINKSMATLLPHETDCTKYYICESGEPILRFCPYDLHFNPKKLVCDFPARAGCETGELHAQLAQPEATGSPSPFCPLVNGVYPIFFPHPTNCSIYYMCGNGIAYEFTCKHGLHFNVRLKTCDYPWRANCKQEDF